MKSFLIAIIAIIVAALACRAQDEEELIPEKPIIESRDSNKNNLDYDAVVIGGVGYSNSVYDYYSYAPTLTIGFEIPFANSHMSSFQMYSHVWVDNTLNLDHYSGHYNESKEAFVSLGNGYYSMYGLAVVFKFYILDKNSDLRFSIHFGGLFLTPRFDYPGFDFGFTGYYRIDQSIMLSLERRYNFMPGICGAGGNCPTPCTGPIITTLNLYYFLKW